MGTKRQTKGSKESKLAPIGSTRDTWDPEDLALMDDAFTEAMKKEHRPRRRRTIEDFVRDLELIKRARGAS